MILAIAFTATAVVSGYVGNVYGARVATAAIAEYLTVKAKTVTEYAAVVTAIKADTSAVIAKVKSLL